MSQILVPSQIPMLTVNINNWRCLNNFAYYIHVVTDKSGKKHKQHRQHVQAPILPNKAMIFCRLVQPFRVRQQSPRPNSWSVHQGRWSASGAIEMSQFNSNENVIAESLWTKGEAAWSKTWLPRITSPGVAKHGDQWHCHWHRHNPIAAGVRVRGIRLYRIWWYIYIHM